MPTTSPVEPMEAIAQFVRTAGDEILSAWRRRIRNLPASHAPSFATHGDARVLDWLASSLEQTARNPDASIDFPADEAFSAPKSIAELALLTETIDRLRPTDVDDAGFTALNRLINTTIAHGLAREADEVERLRKRLRLATDVTLVGAWEFDPVSGVVGADARSRELFGMAPGAPATLESLTSRLHPVDANAVRLGIARTIESGRPYMDDCRVQSDDGATRWLAIAADAHRVDRAPLTRVLAIVHDITDRKRTEEEHARVVQELSRAVHISEMFVGILSHDLRNPLSAILAGSQLLGSIVPDPRSAQILSRVVSSGQRMERMIDQLLDFTRAREGQGIPLFRESVDLTELARDAIEEGKAVYPTALIRLTVRGDMAGTWDRERLSQILSNLVGNALQHGQPPGDLEIVLDGTDPQRVVYSVENPGSIPPDVLPVLFNPFRGTFQKRGKSRGLGLGLYVARQIALAHGGELEAASTSTSTLFRLRLPRDVPSAFASKPDFEREEELAAFERMAAPPSAVTAQLFGITPMHERAPLEHGEIVERYGALLDTALHRKVYRGQGEGLADGLRALAERLGDLGAGPREVTEVHARALRLALRGVTAARTQALLSEGRLLALELMGNLVTYYRRRSTRTPSRGG